MRLSNAVRAQGRDNNLNLLRILAALAVLISHSFALATGDLNAQPLRLRLGITPGAMAVDVFFVTSGFLVTGSLLKRRGVTEFLAARVLRIYPALLFMVGLSVLAIGVGFTTLSPGAFLSSSVTAHFFAKNATLITGASYELPGVFVSNPYKFAVNGSLWTMPFELWMYCALAVVWTLSRAAQQYGELAFKFGLVALAIASGVAYIRHLGWPTHQSPGDLVHLTFMFFTGATYFILKDRLILSHSIFWTLLCAVIIAALNKIAFGIVWAFAVAYLALFVAYVPSGVIRSYNKLGDYSYGIYIYAFPVQQTLAALYPGISVVSMTVVAVTITLTLSVMSWHLIEKRALQLKMRRINADSNVNGGHIGLDGQAYDEFDHLRHG